MDKLYIIIPAYNEEENIKNVIENWYPIVMHYGNDSKMVVIDDGSKDNTFKIILECADNFHNGEIIPMTKPNSGHGATILFGYSIAIQNNADYIFQTDSDQQTLVEEFQNFWEIREDYDIIIGHRIKREDGYIRIFVSMVLKLILRIIFGTDIKDANTPFRLINTNKLKEYINLIPTNFNLTNVIISVIFKKKGCKMKFIPITFLQRQHGINSINIFKIIKIGLVAIKDFCKINEELQKN